MKRRIAAVALALALVGTLAGCEDADADARRLEYKREQIQLGKECADAGGQWVYNGWGGGWLCEFRSSD